MLSVVLAECNSALGREFHNVFYWSESLSLQEQSNGNEMLSVVLAECNSALGREFHNFFYWSESLSLQEQSNGSGALKFQNDSEWCLES
jgi:hypothetical protein